MKPHRIPSPPPDPVPPPAEVTPDPTEIESILGKEIAPEDTPLGEDSDDEDGDDEEVGEAD